jgi:hypothetical protein
MQAEHRQAAADARLELTRTSRLRPARRRDLTQTIASHEQVLRDGQPETSRLDREIDTLTRHVAADTRERERERRARRINPAFTRRGSAEAYLAPGTPTESITRLLARSQKALERAAVQQPYRAPERRRRMTPPMPGRTRDDNPGIGR